MPTWWLLPFVAFAADEAPPPPPSPPVEESPPTAAPPEESDESLIVIIHAPHADRDDTHARDTIDGEALERAAGDDLGTTVTEVPGVVAQRGSADTAKPVIRGLQERRLLLLHDGIRHESQKWGVDHAPEIDPFSAGSIGVIKGAAGVKYGPDAIGGVILVDPPEMRSKPGVGGTVQWVGVSNGWRGVGAARLDAAFARIPGLSLRVEGNYGRGAAQRAPGYVLGNTGSETWNLGGAVRYEAGASTLRVTAGHFDQRAGVFYGVQNGTPDDFLAQIDAPRPVGADAWKVEYAIDRPYQAVTHDRVAAHFDTTLGPFATLGVVYAYQANHRQEYEQVRESVTGPQYDFTLRTHSIDASLDHEGTLIGSAALSGGAGLAGSFQENVYSGLPLIPNFRSFGAGVYAFERLSWEKVVIEVGARYDHLSRAAYFGDSAFEAHVRRGTLDEETCAYDGDVARCPAAYDAASVSVGLVTHAVPEVLDVKLDLSSASRFPNADELYLNGTAPTSPVYALGDPSLGVETTWGASPTLGLRLRSVEAEASVYLNYTHQYVYFAPDLDAGVPRFEVTVRGAFPRYVFRPIDALFYGADGGISFGPTAPIGLKLSGSVVRAVEAGTGEFLVGIPADRGRAAVVLRPGHVGPLHDPFLEFEGTFAARQSRVDPALDFAPAPDGYLLIGVAAGAEIDLGDTHLGLGVEARNLFDVAYREYTSLLRYFADEPGREIRVRVRVDR